MLPATPPPPSPIPNLFRLNLPRIDVAVLLGSGLRRAISDEAGGPTLESRRDLAFSDLPDLSPPRAAGHSGVLSLGLVEGVPIGVFRGRLHLYEGYTARQAAQPVAIAAALGAHTLVVTNAAGGLSPDFRVGQLVLIEDHLNLPGMAGANPLAGRADFIPMIGAYDRALLESAWMAGRRLGLGLGRGTYAMVAGPSFETAAEIRYLRLAGATLVGMSTANEVVLARSLGLRVLGVSVVTNSLAGPAESPEHDSVLAVGARATGDLDRLLGAMLPELGKRP
jgi:purine-nucleoside phosphorylase